MVTIAWTPYTRDFEPIMIRNFWPGDTDPMAYLLDKLDGWGMLRQAWYDLIAGNTKDEHLADLIDEHLWVNTEDDGDMDWVGTLEELCKVYEAYFVGDGGHSCTAISVKEGDRYLLQC